MLGCRDNGRPQSHRRIIGIPRVYCAAMIGGQVRSNADTDRFRFRPAFSDSVQECSITRLGSNLSTVNPLPPRRSNHPNGPIPTGNIDGTEQVNLQSTMPRHAIAAEHGQSRRLSVNICSAAHATAYRTRGDRNNNQDSHALHRRTRISPITPVVGLSLPPLTAHSAPAEDSCSASADTEMSLRCSSASVETTHGLRATGDPGRYACWPMHPRMAPNNAPNMSLGIRGVRRPCGVWDSWRPQHRRSTENR